MLIVLEFTKSSIKQLLEMHTRFDQTRKTATLRKCKFMSLVTNVPQEVYEVKWDLVIFDGPKVVFWDFNILVKPNATTFCPA